MSVESDLRAYEARQDSAAYRWECMTTSERARHLIRTEQTTYLERLLLLIYCETEGDTAEMGRRVNLAINDYLEEL